MHDTEKRLTHNGLSLTYVVRRSRRARRHTLSVFRDGTVRVTMPYRADDSRTEEFVKSHSEWITRKLEQFKDLPQPQPPLRGHIHEYKKLKETARAHAHARLAHFNEHYNFKYGRIAIKNMNTRWGSCSAKGNLNFHYKLALLPPELTDYLVVHELCHIGQMNHSEKFWALVAQALPNYTVLRKKLRSFRSN